MKVFVKTVSVTLVISVAMLFFSYSSSNKVEAAGAVAGTPVPFVSLPSAEQDIFYEALERFAMEVFGYDTSPETSYTMPDGSVIKGTKSEVMEEIKNRANQEYINAMQDSNGTTMYYVFTHPDECTVPSVLIDEFCSTTHKSYSNGVHGGAGKLRVEASAYNSAVSDIVTNSIKTTTGSAAGITFGVSTVNGKPQKVTTTYLESTVDVFDYLGLRYKLFDKITDFKLEFTSNNCPHAQTFYLPFIITKDNELIVPNQYSYFYSDNVSIVNGNLNGYISCNQHFGSSVTSWYFAMRYYEKNGIICYSTYLSLVFEKKLRRYQNIYSSPKLESVPILFTDPLSYQSIELNEFENFDYSSINSYFCFRNCYNSDLIYYNDILNYDIKTAGYFYSGNSVLLRPSGSTLKSAAKMLNGSENIVQGGTNTTYSDLSDIEKAIYALAKQNGKTYDEMLEQSNLVVENGQIYLEGLDGVSQSIESLLAEFDKLLEQGSISNEQGAATVEQLTALLEYIKSLNIEGTNDYISKIEATLDSLNHRDEDQSALLADVVGTLRDLKEFLSSLGVDSISEDIKSISTALAEARAKETASSDFQKKMEEEIYTAVPFNNDFKLYNQCKYFIETVFNYDDIVSPPNFSFYWDSDGDGVKEIYNPFDFSILETKLTNENMVDKSILPIEIKVIDVIRYVIALCIYGLFVMRLIKRLPTFYGSGPWAQL